MRRRSYRPGRGLLASASASPQHDAGGKSGCIKPIPFADIRSTASIVPDHAPLSAPLRQPPAKNTETRMMRFHPAPCVVTCRRCRRQLFVPKVLQPRSLAHGRTPQLSRRRTPRRGPPEQRLAAVADVCVKKLARELRVTRCHPPSPPAIPGAVTVKLLHRCPRAYALRRSTSFRNFIPVFGYLSTI